MDFALQPYTGEQIDIDCREPKLPKEAHLVRLERLAREGGVGDDLSKMSKEDMLKILLAQ